jgi:hypothetical protein
VRIHWRIVKYIATKLTDWDEILSADCPVGALQHLVCCVEATMVVHPRIPREWGRVFLKIQGCYAPPVSCGWVHLFLELIAHGSPQYSQETGFLKKAEAFLYLWLINPWISHGIIGETDSYKINRCRQFICFLKQLNVCF